MCYLIFIFSFTSSGCLWLALFVWLSIAIVFWPELSNGKHLLLISITSMSERSQPQDTNDNRLITKQSWPSNLGQASVAQGDEGRDKEWNADSKEESGIDQKLNMENDYFFTKRNLEETSGAVKANKYKKRNILLYRLLMYEQEIGIDGLDGWYPLLDY